MYEFFNCPVTTELVWMRYRRSESSVQLMQEKYRNVVLEFRLSFIIFHHLVPGLSATSTLLHFLILPDFLARA